MAIRLHKVQQEFLDTIKQNNLIQPNDKIVVGVSGGPDSATLLDLLYKYKDRLNYQIFVAHVNHLIREDSTDDEQFVENWCEKLGIKCFIKRENVEKMAKEKKKSTEDMGRIIRYEFFDEVAEKTGANKIAIAHNMNDNAETLLLNLVRGSGLSGLEGIKPLEYNKYIRPLINCKREDIEEYCEKNNLKPRIDSTNKENIYKRNIIRNKILPELKELNPNIVQTLSRTANIVAENNQMISDEVEKTYNQLATETENKVEFELKDFNSLSNYLRKQILLKAIESLLGNTKNIQKVNLDDVIKMAQKNIGCKQIKINKNILTEIKKSKLIISILS